MDSWSGGANHEPGGGGKRKWKQHQHYLSSALEKGRERATAANSQTSIPGRRKSRLAASGSYDLFRVADSPDVDLVSVRSHASSRCFILAGWSLNAVVCSCKTVMNSPSIERGQTDSSEFDRAQCVTLHSNLQKECEVKRVSQTSVVSFDDWSCSNSVTL